MRSLVLICVVTVLCADMMDVCLSLTGVEDARLSADEMDLRRQESIAYEYLCHLEEAKMYVEFSCVLS